jgi:predicted transcriptional regulator
MSKLRIGIAVLGASLVFLATVPTSTVQARGLHIRMGGGPLGIVRSAVSHVIGIGGSHGRRYARRGDRVRLANLRDDTTASLPRTDVTRGADWVTRPVARVQLAAATALAGWHGGRGANGWWRHEDGGYGWVGPLFWPFAYYDIYDYTVWGDGMGFWGYGYRDIHAAIFTPYGSDDLVRYATPSHGRRHARIPSLTKLCGDDAGEVATLPIDQIRQTIQLSDEQRAALDDLANASTEAAHTIRAACPMQAALTAPARLAAMQQRVEAMTSAVAGMRPPLEKFYELLDDEQRARLAALAEQRTQTVPKVPAAQSCTAPEAFPWPGSEIEAGLHLNEAQRGAAEWLVRMSAKARNILNFDCEPDEGLAAPDRLATVDTRLDAMLEAIKLVRPALEEFYATLNDEQKAQFETIGAKRTS